MMDRNTRKDLKHQTRFYSVDKKSEMLMDYLNNDEENFLLDSKELSSIFNLSVQKVNEVKKKAKVYKGDYNSINKLPLIERAKLAYNYYKISNKDISKTKVARIFGIDRRYGRMYIEYADVHGIDSLNEIGSKYIIDEKLKKNIKEDYYTKGMSCRELAVKYKIPSTAAISRIVNK